MLELNVTHFRYGTCKAILGNPGGVGESPSFLPTEGLKPVLNLIQCFPIQVVDVKFKKQTKTKHGTRTILILLYLILIFDMMVEWLNGYSF